MTGGVLAIVIAVVVVIVAVVVASRRRANDGVDSFRRQIDALSPEARRPVVDQVQNAAEQRGVDDAAGPAPADATPADDLDDDLDDEGGLRGA